MKTSFVVFFTFVVIFLTQYATGDLSCEVGEAGCVTSNNQKINLDQLRSQILANGLRLKASGWIEDDQASDFQLQDDPVVDDVTGPSRCVPGCASYGSMSCQYCPLECGYCYERGVIDHCVSPGTIHISIDDGPAPTTGQILDILKAEGVQASFWVIGNLIEERGPLVLRMLNENHTVGSHTYTHSHINSWTDGTPLELELEMTQQAYFAVTGGQWGNLTHFRPPYGELNNIVCTHFFLSLFSFFTGK